MDKIRKISMFLLFNIILAGWLGTGVSAAEYTVKQADGYKYVEYEDGVWIVSYVVDEEDDETDWDEVTKLVIPDELAGKPVIGFGKADFVDQNFQIPYYRSKIQEIAFPKQLKYIGEDAFYGLQVSAVVLPDSLEKIGTGAFMSNDKLTSVSLPSKVKEIGRHVFRNCVNLKTVQFSKGLETIGDHAFDGCKSLAEVSLPEGTTTIGDSAFSGCIQLAKISFPESLKTIGYGAFDSCISLKTISIPAGVEDIGTNAFSKCTGVTSYQVAEGNQKYGSYQDMLCKIESDGEEQTIYVLNYPCAKKGKLNIEDNMEISVEALAYAAGITEITVAEGNEDYTVEEGVLLEPLFDGVLYLIAASSQKTGEYVVPNGVQRICTGAFSNSQVSKIVIPDTVTVISEDAFYHCAQLESVQIGKGVEYIGDNFNGCPKMKEVSISEENQSYSSVSSAIYDKEGQYISYCPTAYQGEFAFSDDVKYFYRSAFEIKDLDETVTRCEGITQWSFGEKFDDMGRFANYCYDSSLVGTETVGEYGYEHPIFKDQVTLKVKVSDKSRSYKAADGIIYNYDKKELLLCTSDAGNDVVIPDGVSSISDYSFTHKVNSVQIPESVTGISANSGLNGTVRGYSDSWAEWYAEQHNLEFVKLGEGSGQEQNIISVKSVAIREGDKEELKVGDTLTLHADVTPSDATNQEISWSSDHQDVASVSKYGMVTAQKVGTATITAVTADGNKQASFIITVVEADQGESGDESGKDTGEKPADSDVMAGDLNGDKKVNSTDVILLRRHVAGGYGVTINEKAADVNADGKLNSTDVILIRRYIAGGYGVELKTGK